jgi:hypothetical protein
MQYECLFALRTSTKGTQFEFRCYPREVTDASQILAFVDVFQLILSYLSIPYRRRDKSIIIVIRACRDFVSSGTQFIVK